MRRANSSARSTAMPPGVPIASLVASNAFPKLIPTRRRPVGTSSERAVDGTCCTPKEANVRTLTNPTTSLTIYLLQRPPLTIYSQFIYELLNAHGYGDLYSQSLCT